MDEMRAKAESDKQYQAHLDSLEESKKYLDKDGNQPQPKTAGGSMMAGDDDPEEQYGWWYGMGKDKKRFHGKDGRDNSKPLPWQQTDKEGNLLPPDKIRGD